MNIFKYEFNSYTKSMITWIISMGLIVIWFMAFYPTFGADVEAKVAADRI